MRIVRGGHDVDYETYQALLVTELVQHVRAALEDAGMEGELLRDLVAEIASGFGSIIDGSASISTDDDDSPLTPILGFARGRLRDRLLLPEQGGGSSLHEFVWGAVAREFEGEGDD